MVQRFRTCILLTGLLLFCLLKLIAQDQKIADSLYVIYRQGHLKGINKLELLLNLSYNTSDTKKSLKYANELIEAAEVYKNDQFLYRGYSQKGQTFRLSGDLTYALEALFKAREVAARIKDKSFEGGAYLTIADVYSESGNSENAEIYYTKSINLLKKTKDTITLIAALLNAGDDSFHNNKLNKALGYFKESETILKKIDYPIGKAYNSGNLGMVYASSGKDELAEYHINEALNILEKLEDHNAISDYLTFMSDIYVRRNDFKAALSYAKRSLNLSTRNKMKEQISRANLTLSEVYEKAGNPDLSLSHYKAYIANRDSIINIENVQQLADLRTNYEISKKQTEVDLLKQTKKNQRFLTIIIGVGLLLMALFAFSWYRRYLFIKKTNLIIEKEKDRSEQAFSELQATQAQLIQQEKLASLGQLTAGIAHEIKNPLNFVNNFSDFSIKLTEEAMDELQKTDSNPHTEEVKVILSDISVNLKKIHEHGTRANNIVSSMLLHSRGGSGKREPTDLNTLLKEYVNLCFLGMRAAKNPIQVEIKMNLDDNIYEVHLNKEEFSRVIINVCNNAFDAMRSKKMAENDENYLPTLTITTKKEKNFVLLIIEDNGPGIPANIRDKIFQPFFTTKKGTEGTGLGLSITHDIIKGHNAELNVESSEGKGTSFIIRIPD
ncbi:MAG: tetratricopeptide repeat protein [Saprospiraceae bacterium]|nr:tetratricopeptide repeat protein [Saprospiraceae bacterium]MBK6564476.1 tetratricopeptide repeat protein [Saprospiraceae bacterium]MBK8371889.1 tetratricopeptide repeat protein [Saprospiraceae bacterium]MBK8820320.1 tetratricopeptide repeat protein [Saprospiraceae bacterium]MBK9042154.1 tetratricopeptide repeat protein [Saprospiraceae bacterium]